MRISTPGNSLPPTTPYVPHTMPGTCAAFPTFPSHQPQRGAGQGGEGGVTGAGSWGNSLFHDVRCDRRAEDGYFRRLRATRRVHAPPFRLIRDTRHDVAQNPCLVVRTSSNAGRSDADTQVPWYVVRVAGMV